MLDPNQFDPNGVGLNQANIFGLPTNTENAEVIIIPVPWEVTVSYRSGTANAPEAIFDESYQVDLYDPDTPNAWHHGYYMLPINEEIRSKSNNLRSEAERFIQYLVDGSPEDLRAEMQLVQNEINRQSAALNEWVYNTAKEYLQQGKKVALLGGDHSTPIGIIKAIAEQHAEIGVLQIDAHADLRKAYEGFTYSHASVMYNVLQEIPQVQKLVQVGIRDYCDEELELIQAQPQRIRTFFDRDIKNASYHGKAWAQQVDEIIAELPNKIYISFDIDGLDPKLCPNTGTPVPGGFEMQQVFYLFQKIKETGIHIVGFDLNEVSVGNEEVVTSGIDAIVGARLLYKLCNYLASSK